MLTSVSGFFKTFKENFFMKIIVFNALKIEIIDYFKGLVNLCPKGTR